MNHIFVFNSDAKKFRRLCNALYFDQLHYMFFIAFVHGVRENVGNNKKYHNSLFCMLFWKNVITQYL